MGLRHAECVYYFHRVGFRYAWGYGTRSVPTTFIVLGFAIALPNLRRQIDGVTARGVCLLLLSCWVSLSLYSTYVAK